MVKLKESVTAAALLAFCAVGFAAPAAPAASASAAGAARVVPAEQGASIAGRLLLVSYPGIPIAETLPLALESRLSGQALPDFGPPASRMDSVTIPGIAARNKLADTAHWLLGAATVVAGGVTGLLGSEAGDDGEGGGGGGGGSLHHTFGYVTAGLAAATLLSGLWAHHGDVGVSDGLSAANVHALLGITGGLMIVATPFVADAGGGGDDGGGGHAALGMGGELLMGIAVVWPLVF